MFTPWRPRAVPTSPITPGRSSLAITISVPESGASMGTPSIEESRGLAGSTTMPSTQRSRVALRSLTEISCMKSRGRLLRDSTTSRPRSPARARALTAVTLSSERDSAPASTALPITFS